MPRKRMSKERADELAPVLRQWVEEDKEIKSMTEIFREFAQHHNIEPAQALNIYYTRVRAQEIENKRVEQEETQPPAECNPDHCHPMVLPADDEIVRAKSWESLIRQLYLESVVEKLRMGHDVTKEDISFALETAKDEDVRGNFPSSWITALKEAKPNDGLRRQPPV